MQHCVFGYLQFTNNLVYSRNSTLLIIILKIIIIISNVSDNYLFQLRTHSFTRTQGNPNAKPSVINAKQLYQKFVVRDSDFFFVPRPCHVDQFTFHISLPSLKFTIFIQLSLLTMTSTVLILAVCRMPVIYELS